MRKGKRRAPPPPPSPDRRTRDSKMEQPFREDLRYWVNRDPRVADRLLRIVEEVMRTPFEGIGKPEPLRRLPNTWSRRLTDEHRVVYCVADDCIDFLHARYHYSE